MDDGISIVSGNCSIRKYTYFRFERDFTKSHSQFTMLNHTTRKLLNVLFLCILANIFNLMKKKVAKMTTNFMCREKNGTVVGIIIVGI